MRDGHGESVAGGGIAAANGVTADPAPGSAALNGAIARALDGAHAVLGQYGDLLSEAHRQLALLMWRGILPADWPSAPGRAIDDIFTRAAALTEAAARLQLECLGIAKHAALGGLDLLAPSRGQPAGDSANGPATGAG